MEAAKCVNSQMILTNSTHLQMNNSNRHNFHQHPLLHVLQYKSALFVLLSSLAILFGAIHFAALSHAMRNRRVSRKFNILVLNKSLADAIFCLCFLLFGIFQIATKNKFKLDQNVFLFYFIYTFPQSLLICTFFSYSSYSLLRIYGIRWPFRFRKKFMMKQAIQLNIFSWTLFLFFTLLPLLFLQLFDSMDFSLILFAVFLSILLNIIQFAKSLLLICLQITIIVALSINVYLIYQNWRFSRAFHNARRTSCTPKVDHQLQQTVANNPQMSNGFSGFSPSSVPTPQSQPPQLDRTPSIVNRRHQFSLVKSTLNLIAISTLHIPLIFMEIKIINQHKIESSSLLWTLAIAGVLLRIWADTLLGIFCDIEVYKSFLQILHNLLPKYFRPSPLSAANYSGSSLTIIRGGSEKFTRNGTRELL